MTSCIIGKKIGVVGSGHFGLFPFVVLAICKCQNIETMLSLMAMAGGISEHMLTSLSLYPRHTKYAKGVYSFCLFCLCVCVCVSELTFILCQRFLKNYFT